MYVQRVQIQNIRSISALDWEIPAGTEAGWHVVIGDNGAGKSTFVRSVSLLLAGVSDAGVLRQDWNRWLAKRSGQGSVHVTLIRDAEHDPLPGDWSDASLSFGAKIVRGDAGAYLERVSDFQIQLVSRVMSDARTGWFSAAYGPFRRFTGGSEDFERLYKAYPRLAAHLSVFGEGVALTESISWLQGLQFQKLEGRREGDLLDLVTAFINQEDFLPHGTRLRSVSSTAVEFVDGNGVVSAVEDLSDGYRSILSMTFELIRQLASVYKPEQIFDPANPTHVIVPGVVLIDEIDAHLHPSWQRRVGKWFREHFPKMQFIVTTHSPLICQAATVGSVFRLPRPGFDEPGEMVTGIELDRLLYGNVLEAYGTELFGEDVTRSDEGKQRLKRLAVLNQKEKRGDLTPEEQKEQQGLRATLPTEAYTEAHDPAA